MKKVILLAIPFILVFTKTNSQISSSPLSGNAAAASKLAEIPVNYYTGMPQIGVPLYNYRHQNGLELNVSLSYFSGGIRVVESPTPVGVGWYLNAGGVITRTVRGMPDDISANGYMYAPNLPSDFSSTASKYYYDTLDAEQDVFQFNVNGRSGKFFIGKNKQIVQVPLTKMKITYTTSGVNTSINSFTIISEDGVKYVFSEQEVQTRNTFYGGYNINGYNNLQYTTAWYIKQMISPMATDTIKFSYNSRVETFSDDSVSLGNCTGYVSNGTLVRTGGVGFEYFTTVKKIASVSFPDTKTIFFIYDKKYRYDGRDSCLRSIKVCDSTFRYGYLFSINSADYLNAITFYTKNAQKRYYSFNYMGPTLALNNVLNSVSNQRDHWGFYNGIDNGSKIIPKVSGIYETGADRKPLPAVVAGSLFSIVDKDSGVTYYNFEPNTKLTNGTIGRVVGQGGIRIRQITRYDPYKKNPYDTLATYKYTNLDSSSSGFLGAIPIYNHPYSETVVNGNVTTTTNYSAIESDPVNVMNYTQGSPVGYSRVEVIKGSESHNIGKIVYEFTSLQDSIMADPTFPYAPINQKDWLFGLAKKISIYDSAGILQKTTTNTYSNISAVYNTQNFQSLKLGITASTYYGDPIAFGTPKKDQFIGQYYYLESGRSDLVSSIDSIYHSDRSLQIIQQTLQYDTNYNVIKVTTPYDKTRGLVQERRLYYPYNYTVGGAIGVLRDSGIIAAPISEETWIIGDANPRMLSATATDYQQLPGKHIKPAIVYALQANTPVSQSTMGVFNPDLLVRNAAYIKAQQTFTIYDKNGNLLETKNPVSGIYSSIILDYNNQYPIAQVSNSRLADVAYTSFEADSTGKWIVNSLARIDTTAVTGKRAYNLANGNITRSNLNASQSYILTLWTLPGASVNVNGAALSGSLSQHSGWNFYTKIITNATVVTLSGTGIVDELRLMPKDANMVTATYEPTVGATSQSDANNTIQYRVYDKINHIQMIIDNDKNIVQKYQYSDSVATASILPNWQTWTTTCNGTQATKTFRDINVFSDSYDSTYTTTTTDCIACPVACPTGPQFKRIGCNCETGTRVNISSVYTKIDGTTWKWVCTYQYCFSDGTHSATFTENNDRSCAVSGTCLYN